MAKAAGVAAVHAAGNRGRSGCASVAIRRLLCSWRKVSAALHHAHDSNSGSSGGGQAHPRGLPRPARETLAAAFFLGVKEFYRIGGAQAIAALAYGTKSIPRVDKIVGPGNLFVTEAKRQVAGEVGIDMMAGPTEVLIIADGHADVRFIAADMIAQAEHDEDACA